MDKRKEEASRWLKQAEKDLKTAGDMIEKENYNWACFICQQAAEKALKSVYISRAESSEPVHSLFYLLRGDAKRGLKGIPELQNMTKEAQELDKVYIPTRYPNGIPTGIPSEFYTQKDGEKCLRMARKIVGAVKKLF